MSSTAAGTPLPVVDRRRLTTSEQDLIAILRSKASWIWTTERAPISAPKAPIDVQRAFRKSFFFPSGSKPISISIMVAADDYFVMYVNGALAQVGDPRHDYKTIKAFNVPLPVVKNDSASAWVVLGFRVVNQVDNAGLLVAAQVNYEGDRAPDVFYTGLDQTWLGESLFAEQWEQPSFDSTAQASGWKPARVYTAAELSPAIPSLARQEVVVLDCLPAANGNAAQQGPTPSSATELCSGSGCNQGIGLSKGGFAGSLVGSIVLAFLVGSALSFFLTRRRYRNPTLADNGSGFWAVSSSQLSQPVTTPGRTQTKGRPVVVIG